MIEDPKIRKQVHTYFVSEVQELLLLIEQKLLTFQEDHSKATVHEIIRAAHTIKGGAANLELETITAVAHSLEDIFKSLYNPDLVIDSELHSLLLEAYECLCLPVMAEITKSKIDKEEVLERSASVFAKLQTILGDSFGDQSHIPSSEELGFDVARSIFEKGVKERLEKIAAAIARGNVGEVEATLRGQAEVFVGLGESLNLPEFREIATTILTALDTPNAEVMEIASVALADLQRARDAVLGGDRSRGREPSAMLQQVATGESGIKGVLPYIRELYPKSLQQKRSDLSHFLARGDEKSKTKPLKPHAVQSYLRAVDYILGWFYHELTIPINNLSLELLVAREKQQVIVVNTDLDYIKAWLGKFRQFIRDEGESKSLELYRYWWILSTLLLVVKFKADLSIIKSLGQRIKQIAKQYQQLPPLSKDEKQQLESGKLQNLLVVREEKEQINKKDEEILEQIWGGDNLSLSETLGERVDDSQEIGETGEESKLFKEEEKEVKVEEIPATIEENDSSPTWLPRPPVESNIPQYVQVDVRALQRLNYLTGELLINQNRQALQEERIKVAVQELFSCLEQHKETLNQLKYNKASQIENNEIATVKKGNFDVLELDRYTDFHLQLHTALQETAQLEKARSAINLLTNEQSITFEKQQRLLSSVRDDLQEAQMIPLGNLLNSFPDMIAKLAKVYGKLVDFRITGSQVLVDKAIGEKLYAPLLQLVRNAFDHGIESTEIRRKKGKEERGLIGIYAYHQGPQAIVEVGDDGQGLNFEKIRRRGMEMGLVPDGGTVPTQEELTALLFQPGFSTAAKVSEISGRGMGLDIVRSQIEALQGSVKVQPNLYGGTTFILQIPFSMTTAKLLVIRAGDHVYALLLETIEKIILPNAAQRSQIEESQVFYWGIGDNSELLRVRKISDFMHYNRSANGVLQEKKKLLNKAAPLLLLGGETKLIALEVDEIIAEQELVIRPVGKTIASPPYVCGCTILGDGGLALVIDSGVLVQLEAVLEESTTQHLPMTTRVLPQQPQYFLTPSPEEAKEKLKRLQPRNLNLVLVIDDAISIRQTLTLTLEKQGYQVLQAADGVEALEQLHHSSGVSLMVCDLEMPRMNGFEVLNHLSSDPALSKIPVVILTSRQSEKHRRLAEELGAIAYFTKPYSEPELLTTISELIMGGGLVP